MSLPLVPLGDEPPLSPIDQLLGDVSLQLGHGVGLRSGPAGWELHTADHGYLGVGATIGEALRLGLRHTRRNDGDGDWGDDEPDVAPVVRQVAPPLVATVTCECRSRRSADGTAMPGCRGCGFRGERSAELVVCVDGPRGHILHWADPARATAVHAGPCPHHLDCRRLALPTGGLFVDALVASGATTATHTLLAATDDTVPFAGWSDLYCNIPAGCQREPADAAPTLLAALAGWGSVEDGRGPALPGVGVDDRGRAVGWSAQLVERTSIRGALEQLAADGELWLSGAGLTLGDPGWRLRHRGVDLVEGWLLADVVHAAVGLACPARR